jgi:CBS domain-containing protein
MQCPSCNHENIEGTDRCENCLTPLTKLDSPEAECASGLECSVMENNLGHLDQEDAVLAGLNTPAIEVVRQMSAQCTGCALVLDGNRVAGIFTEHDVLKKLGTSEAQLEAPVREFMSPNPEILHEGHSVAAALNKMSIGRYRHIPVAKRDGSYAVVSIKNVLKYIAREEW